MANWIYIISILALIVPTGVDSTQSSEHSHKARVLSVAQKMESTFKEMKDYTCDLEIIYYQDGIEDQRWRLQLSFKKERKIRMDFYHPWRSTVFYKDGDERIVLKPFRLLPLKFRFSLYHSMATTPSGQRLDQADLQYLLNFLFRNLKSVRQMEDEFEEDGELVRFRIRALDHVEGKHLQRYRLFVSKKNWLPIRLERYSLEGRPIEVAIFTNYRINTDLEDKFFRP
jgi:outer membrane lipoprotein-sorting protein